MRTLNKNHLDKIVEYVVNWRGMDNWYIQHIIKNVIRHGKDENDLKDDIESALILIEEKGD